MTLDAAWTPEGAGRTRGTIVESADMGDMKHGDLVVEECFGADGRGHELCARRRGAGQVTRASGVPGPGLG